MKKLTIYEYPKCGTCRSAVKTLKGLGRELDQKHIVESPPTAEQLKQLLTISGVELKKFFNTSGDVYRSMGLKDKLASMSEQQQLELLASNGMLIKRPIVTDGTKVTIGYKEEMYKEVWGE